MKHFKLAAVSLALAAFTAGGASYAADSALNRGDTRFLQRAAQSGMLEIQASKLAVERAENPQIKEFAQRMISDHTAVDKELRSLAQSKNVELPTDLRWGQGRTMKGLEKDEGTDFDERYVDKVAVDAHEDAVELFQDAAEDAEDPDVKAFAAKTLPNLQQHLQMGEALQNAVQGRPAGPGDRGTMTDTSPSSMDRPTSGGTSGAGTAAPGATGAGGTGASGTGAGTAGSTTGTGAGSPGAAPSPGATTSPGATPSSGAASSPGTASGSGAATGAAGSGAATSGGGNGGASGAGGGAASGGSSGGSSN